jgi:hypothetical protein
VDELRGDYVGEDFVAVAQDRCGGLVTGGLDTEDELIGHSVYRTSEGTARWRGWTIRDMRLRCVSR